MLSFKKRVLGLALFVLSVLTLPLSLGLTVTFQIYRKLLNIYIKLFRPDLISLVEGSANLFLVEDPYLKPINTIGSHIVVEGNIDPEGFGARYGAALRKSHWEEICKVPVTFMGYFAWRRLPYVQIEDLIKEMEPGELEDIKGEKSRDCITESDIVQFIHQYLKKPFPKNSPLHDVTLCRGLRVEGARNPCTLLIYRLHHSVGDGLSLCRLGSLSVDDASVIQESIEKMKKCLQPPKLNAFQRLGFAIAFPIIGIYQMCMMLVDSKDTNVWHSVSSPTRRDYNYAAFKVSMKDVRVVRERHEGVSLFSVFLAVKTVAIRRYFLKKGLPIPKAMHLACTMPVPNLLPTLGNRFTFVGNTLPVGLNRRSEIIQEINSEQTRNKTSCVPMMVLFMFERVNSCLPSWIIRKLSHTFTTGMCTNMPGNNRAVTIFGNKGILQGAQTTIKSNQATYMWCFGYDGQVGVTIGVSEDVMTERTSVEEFVDMMREEFLNLTAAADNIGEEEAENVESERTCIIDVPKY